MGDKSFIYLITTTDFQPVKVGVSCSATLRLAQLQGAHWQDLLLCGQCQLPKLTAYSMERRFKVHFRDKRLLGEWFDVTGHEAKDWLDRNLISCGVAVQETDACDELSQLLNGH